MNVVPPTAAMRSPGGWLAYSLAQLTCNITYSQTTHINSGRWNEKKKAPHKESNGNQQKDKHAYNSASWQVTETFKIFPLIHPPPAGTCTYILCRQSSSGEVLYVAYGLDHVNLLSEIYCTFYHGTRQV